MIPIKFNSNNTLHTTSENCSIPVLQWLRAGKIFGPVYYCCLYCPLPQRQFKTSGNQFKVRGWGTKPKARRGGIEIADCGSRDPGSIPVFPSPSVGPLMARLLQTSWCQCQVRPGTLKTHCCPWRWVPSSRSKFGNWTFIPSLYSWNIPECDVKPQTTNKGQFETIMTRFRHAYMLSTWFSEAISENRSSGTTLLIIIISLICKHFRSCTIITNKRTGGIPCILHINMSHINFSCSQTVCSCLINACLERRLKFQNEVRLKQSLI